SDIEAPPRGTTPGSDERSVSLRSWHSECSVPDREEPMFGRTAAIAATLLTLQAGTVADADGLSADRVREAFQWGLVAPEVDLAQYELRTDRTWLVNFDTPFLRVAQLSRAMKIQNTPFTEADVSPKTSADEVHIYAHARPDAVGGRATLPNIEFM